MPSDKPSYTADIQGEAQPSLMARASQSTANLGWLQDYTLDWQTARSVCIRLSAKQKEQATMDIQARDALLAFVAFASSKCEALEAAIVKRREAHERLMIRLNEEIGND